MSISMSRGKRRRRPPSGGSGGSTGGTSGGSTGGTSGGSTGGTSGGNTGGGGMGACGAAMGGGMQNACFIYSGAPPTPGLTRADVTFQRGIYMNGSMTMDDGNCVTIWGFTDLAGGGGGGGMGGGGMGGGANQFPSPAMRLTQNQIAHTVLTVGNMWRHTIHHHGIEPETLSDGVGHISHDVVGTYTYQWRPRNAGTYFYHCHTNTVLHAEMGMYGALIVDPPPNPNDPPGTRRAFANGPIYDVEAVWAVDEIDSRWHRLPWTAGTCGDDVGLNDLNPDYFIVTGVDGASSALTAPGVAVQMTRGQRLLVRYICAGYYEQRVNLGGLTATIVASDGRPLPRPQQVRSFNAVSAERYDMIIQPTRSGTYTISFDILHWITGRTLGTARTRIKVS